MLDVLEMLERQLHGAGRLVSRNRRALTNESDQS